MIKFTVGGRTVDLKKLMDVGNRSILERAASDLERKIKDVKCPVHGRGLENARFELSNPRSPEFVYDACCEKLGVLANAAMQ